MYTPDDTAFLNAFGVDVVRQSDSVRFRGIEDVPASSVDFGLGNDTVRSHERELCYRVSDVTLQRGDVLILSGKRYRVAEEPQEIEDGAFAVALLKP